MSPAVSSARDALGPGAPQQRVDTRHEFRRRERLDHIIVGANAQAAHAFALLAARRQHDHRQVARVVARAQPPADLQSRNARQHPVENDEIGRRFREPKFGFVAAIDMLDMKAFRLKIIDSSSASEASSSTMRMRGARSLAVSRIVAAGRRSFIAVSRG